MTDPRAVRDLERRLAAAEVLLAEIHDEAFALAAEWGEEPARTFADRICTFLDSGEGLPGAHRVIVVP